jgi:Pregnancy-associated plasma protein-A/Secretion system C-terminal sorting domain
MRIFLIILLFACLYFPSNGQMQCRSAEYRDALLIHTPWVAERITNIELFTKNYIRDRNISVNGNAAQAQSPGPIVISVVVHVLYHNAAENISDDQIRSQLEVLNNDYNRLNADTVKTPSIFKPFAGNAGIRFELAKVDPSGFTSSGIVRKYSNVLAYGLDDQLKSTATGGDDAWSSDNYLNIWVVNMSAGVLGYSSVVGGPKEKDGVVVQFNAFGVNGSAAAPFNKGRTATHEIGHWLNLIHTWGDADCGDDQVADTPPQKGPNRGCPSSINITCGQGPYGDMFMNYMDFSDDGCMNLFTNGQVQRMLALFAPGGFRNAILSSNALVGSGIPDSTSQTLATTKSGMSIYPNPAAGSITIQFHGVSKLGSDLEFFNEMGQRVQSNTLNQQTQQVDVSSLRPGIYYIRSTSGIAKLIKM